MPAGWGKCHRVLTKLRIRNFKLFGDVEIELGERVVFIGPNNSGKTSALQALALWDLGVKRWLEKRGGGPAPEKRPGVTINRRDLIAVPAPTARLLWRGLRVREAGRTESAPRTTNVLISVDVEGVDEARAWRCALEFDYANEESFYCRPVRAPEGGRSEVPGHLAHYRLAYLPPMSGIAAREDRLELGAVNVRLGEGRTAEVLRNLCWQVWNASEDRAAWKHVVGRMHALFDVQLEEPRYVTERGEILMSFRTRRGVSLDLSASGRGQQQTLLLLAYMSVHPGSVVLLDEPDAHLEILRQRQIYQLLAEEAERTRSQIVAASHSEVILNEAADRDVVIAFVGAPHRVDDRGSQVAKPLKEIGFEHYALAEESGWVLYLEGATDLAVLQAFARRLGHPAQALLERPFVHYVANQPRKAQEHFYALREAVGGLAGIAIYDRLSQPPPEDPNLTHLTWRRRELENYLCHKETLLAFAEEQGRRRQGELFGPDWRERMAKAIAAIEDALQTLGSPSPWEGELKASDDFLDPLFERFFRDLALPNLMRKTNYHALAEFVPADLLDAEITEKLDAIAGAAARAPLRSAAE